ncbi:MAG: hypothetical protein Q9192_002028 [Flavoplaca navasiana]
MVGCTFTAVATSFALLSALRPAVCFAAAAPAGQPGVERPRYYFPRNIRRQAPFANSSTPNAPEDTTTTSVSSTTSTTPVDNLLSSLLTTTIDLPNGGQVIEVITQGATTSLSNSPTSSSLSPTTTNQPVDTPDETPDRPQSTPTPTPTPTPTLSPSSQPVDVLDETTNEEDETTPTPTPSDRPVDAPVQPSSEEDATSSSSTPQNPPSPISSGSQDIPRQPAPTTSSSVSPDDEDDEPPLQAAATTAERSSIPLSIDDEISTSASAGIPTMTPREGSTQTTDIAAAQTSPVENVGNTSNQRPSSGSTSSSTSGQSGTTENRDGEDSGTIQATTNLDAATTSSSSQVVGSISAGLEPEESGAVPLIPVPLRPTTTSGVAATTSSRDSEEAQATTSNQESRFDRNYKYRDYQFWVSSKPVEFFAKQYQ